MARRQRPSFGWIHPLSTPNERLDDLEGAARLTLRASASEVRGKLAIGAQDLLFADRLLVRLAVTVGSCAR